MAASSQPQALSLKAIVAIIGLVTLLVQTCATTYYNARVESYTTAKIFRKTDIRGPLGPPQTGSIAGCKVENVSFASQLPKFSLELTIRPITGSRTVVFFPNPPTSSDSEIRFREDYRPGDQNVIRYHVSGVNRGAWVQALATVPRLDPSQLNVGCAVADSGGVLQSAENVQMPPGWQIAEGAFAHEPNLIYLIWLATALVFGLAISRFLCNKQSTAQAIHPGTSVDAEESRTGAR